jgi:hypothetical protein
MSDETPDNSAGRFLIVLERMRSPQLRTNNAADAWANILGINVKEPARLLRGIADVGALALEVRDAVGVLDGINAAHLASWVPKFFAPWEHFNLSTPFDQFARTVDDTMLALIRIADDMLHRQRPEPVVPADQLKEIRSQVDLLARDISSAKLDREFKDYLLHHLDIIEEAIAGYRLKGFRSLRRGLEQSVGVCVLDRKRFEKLDTTPLGSRLLKILSAYVLILKAVSGTFQLVDEIEQHLLPNHVVSEPHPEHPGGSANQSASSGE